jgi:putative transposase
MIQTYKIEVFINEPDKEKKAQHWQKMRDLNYQVFKIANACMADLHFNFHLKEKVQDKDRFKEFLNGKSEQNIPYQATKQFADKVGSYVRSAIANKVWLDFKNHRSEVKKGNESAITYKRSMPIYFTKNALCNFSQRGFEFEGVPFEWVLGNRAKSDVNAKVQAIEKIAVNNALLSDSSFIIRAKKIYLLMAFKVQETVLELPEKIAGLDLGVVIPAYISVLNGFERKAIGSENRIISRRTQIQAKRRNLAKNVTSAKGGHGRVRKLRKLDDMGNLERNMVKLVAHENSKTVIDFCVQNKVTILRMEDLTGFKSSKEPKEDGSKEDFILRNWGYYDFQSKIKYKAERAGIKIEYVTAAYTSQKCSRCGHIARENRLTQSEFKCVACGFEANADYNASQNIAAGCVTEKKKGQKKKPKK